MCRAVLTYEKGSMSLEHLTSNPAAENPKSRPPPENREMAVGAFEAAALLPVGTDASPGVRLSLLCEPLFAHFGGLPFWGALPFRRSKPISIVYLRSGEGRIRSRYATSAILSVLFKLQLISSKSCKSGARHGPVSCSPMRLEAVCPVFPH